MNWTGVGAAVAVGWGGSLQTAGTGSGSWERDLSSARDRVSAGGDVFVL